MLLIDRKAPTEHKIYLKCGKFNMASPIEETGMLTGDESPDYLKPSRNKSLETGNVII